MDEAQRLALRLLQERFGEMPPAVVACVEAAEADRCEEVAMPNLGS